MKFNVSSLTGNDRISNCPIIGAVKVNKPFEYTDRSYEVAAWHETRIALEGVHPVYLSRSYHVPKILAVTAHIKAKVTDDYFPALWCGNPVSNKPYEPKNIGAERTIYQSIDVVEAIERTGNTPDDDVSWFIHPSWWSVFTDEALSEMKENYRRLPDFWNDFERLDSVRVLFFHNTFPTRMDGQRTFDDDYRSKVSMIAHFGSLLEKWARRIEKINWRSQYHTKGGCSNNTLYWQELFAKNTEWAKEIPFQINE